MLSLVEDVVVGGPFEVAVAIRPDVVAFGGYFVELIPSLVLKLFVSNKILWRFLDRVTLRVNRLQFPATLTIIVTLNSSAV